jgi:hypothetical protein
MKPIQSTPFSMFLLFLSGMPGLTFGGTALDTFVSNCRTQNFCGTLAEVPYGSPGRVAAEFSECFRKKAASCALATSLGGASQGNRSDDLERTILYGNFCGWRNLSKKTDGNPPDWRNFPEVAAAIRRTPAIDALDEECKAHDLRYIETPFSICDADRELVESLEKMAWDPGVALTPEAREVALAMSEAIRWNRFTCGVITVYQRSRD